MLLEDINNLIERFPDSYEFMNVPNVEELEDNIINTGRWETTWRVVFKRDDEYVAVEYNMGATEYQDAEPNAVAYEVYPVQVVKTVYQRSK